MSLKYMVAAFEAKVGNSARKLVLLKLADSANDDGKCWPSYQHIADQCEMSKRSVIDHIRALEELGYISKESRKVKKTLNQSNVYTINIENFNTENPTPESEKATPKVSGANSALGGGANSAPRTTHSFEPPIESFDASEKKLADENSSTRKKPRPSSLDYSPWPELPDQQILDDWVEHRKQSKAKVSQTVINRYAKELHKAVQLGYSVNHCLSEVICNGWRGFEAQWLVNREIRNQASNQFPIRTVEQSSDFVNKHTDTSWAE